ncbi:3-deoxy-7-phosphoheptulonate synthase [Streptomonospora sediminis]
MRTNHDTESDIRFLEPDAQAAGPDLPAAHQPPWEHHPDLEAVRAQLAEVPGLVDLPHVHELRRLLAQVEAGAAHLLHVGECAETFAMATPDHVERRAALYRRLADRLAYRTGRRVVLVARMAGQHAKPRSRAAEEGRGGEVLTYRGDAVNGADATADLRRPEPRRMLESYARSQETLEFLHRGPRAALAGPLFVSHEALLKDYEQPLTRGGARPYAASGHLVWIGERTRNPHDWHVRWAASLENPVGVKLGPTATGREAAALVSELNARGEAGRLSLIARMGSSAAGRRLAALAGAVATTGLPVLWQCDPMHGNTRSRGDTKLRVLADLYAEITAFVRTLRTSGCHPGGLHLEVTPDDVRECREDAAAPVAEHGTAPPCDPRLNPVQAMDMIDHFADEVGAF